MTPPDEDLDFTQFSAPPPPPPTPQKVAAARTEASTGGPQLAKTGFYVAMARHSVGGKVPPRNGEKHVVFVVEDDMSIPGMLPPDISMPACPPMLMDIPISIIVSVGRGRRSSGLTIGASFPHNRRRRPSDPRLANFPRRPLAPKRRREAAR